LIQSTNDCIFGGYTPLSWNSRQGVVSDPSLASFIFTIKNPHDIPAQIFKQKQADAAIYDHAIYGPRFGDGNNADLSVYDQCRTCSSSYSRLGQFYSNDTGIGADNLLTGACHFTVNEIEVFEVIPRQ
jgi:hypothetical protein